MKIKYEMPITYLSQSLEHRCSIMFMDVCCYSIIITLILVSYLVIQWIRICLPVPGLWVRSLSQEDSTCHGASKAHMPQLLESTCSRAQEPQLLKPEHLEPVLCNKGSHCNNKPIHCNQGVAPLVAIRESPCASVKAQCNQQINKNFKHTFMVSKDLGLPCLRSLEKVRPVG